MLGLFAIKEGGTRCNADVKFKSAIQGDIDTEGIKNKQTGQILQVTKTAPSLDKIRKNIDLYEWFANSTHWHEPQRDVIKYRITILLDRDITEDEHEPILEALDQLLNGALDRRAWQWSQAFYHPSCPPENQSDAFFVHNQGAPLPVDEFVKRGREILSRRNGKPANKKNRSPILESFLSGGDFPPSNIQRVIDGCNAIRDFADKRGNVPYDHWMGAIGVVRRCVDGEQHVHELSSGHPGYSPEETDKKLASLKGGPTKCETLAKLGLCNGCEHRGKITSPIQLGVNDTSRIEHAKKQAERIGREQNTKFPLTHVAALLQEPSPLEWLVYGHLLPDTIVLFVGASAVGKSLTALDIGACVALGMPWHNYRVKQGPVIYIAGEGHFGIRRRLKAWGIHNDTDLSHAPFAVSDTGANFADSGSVQAVIDAIDEFSEEHGEPVLIIIDTLNRNFVGDENSAQEMGVYIHSADELRTRYNCTVITVHHTGHKEPNRARGSSALFGAADCEFVVKKQAEHELTLECSKMKDGPKPNMAAFEILQVELPWLDALGTRETSATIAPIDIPKTKKSNRNMPDGVWMGIGALHSAIKAKGVEVNGLHGKAAYLEDWRENFYVMHKGKDTRTKNQAFNRARRDLLDGRVVVEKDDYFTLTDGAEASWLDAEPRIRSLTRADPA